MHDTENLIQHVRHDVRCVLERDPAARNALEVTLLYPGLHALWAHRVAHALWTHGFRFLGRALSQYARIWTQIEIHPGAQIGKGVFIDHGAGVVIGETAIVGDDVTIYQGVTLGGTSLEHVKRHPTIGDRVIIGSGAKVLGNIEIGNDSRIGANAVVTKSVPDHSVVVGVPGQVIRIAGQDIAARGSGGSVPDPVGNAVHELLSRVAGLEQHIMGLQSEHHTHAESDGADWTMDEADFVI
jgi:serine O-acetyltransferase